jgi:hypothetical protein
MRRERIIETGKATAQPVGAPEMLIRRLTENERLLDMFKDALDVASSTATWSKRVGRVVAQAVKDDAVIDDSAALLAAVADQSNVSVGRDEGDQGGVMETGEVGHFVQRPMRSRVRHSLRREMVRGPCARRRSACSRARRQHALST